MALTEFPTPPDLKLPFKDMVLDGKNHIFSKYDVSNPHPGYGTDPNILNEYGHSVYPKMIYPQGQTYPGVIVNNQAEEDEILKPAPVEQPAPTNNPWPAAK